MATSTQSVFFQYAGQYALVCFMYLYPCVSRVFLFLFLLWVALIFMLVFLGNVILLMHHTHHAQVWELIPFETSHIPPLEGIYRNF